MSVAFGQSVFSGSIEIWTIFYCKAVRKDIFTKITFHCLGDFGPRGLSVQYTQDVRGCPPAHTRHPWLSVAVRVCPSAHTGRPTHRTSVGVRQHTQDVRGCPPAHTGRPWLSVAVRVCLCVSVSTHSTSVAVYQYTYQYAGPWTQHDSPSRGLFGWTSVAVHQYTYQHVGPWTQHAGHSRGLFGTSVGVRQHTQDVCGCLCVSVCVRQHTLDVRGCSSVHISARCTHRTSAALRQHTQPSVAVRVCPTMALPVDCLGDFGPRGLSVQYTQDVRVCPSAHTGCDFGPRGLSVQYTQDVCGCPPAHIGHPWLSVCVRQHTQDVRGFPSVHISARWTSVGVRQHTQDVRWCPSAHTGSLWLSVCVRVCPSAYTGRPWLSISTHISTLVLGLSTLTLPVDYSGDFGPRGLSVKYTQDIRGGPPEHTGRPWLYVAVRVCLCVSIITHRTSVAVHHTHRTSAGVNQHTQDVCGCLWLSVSTHRTSVAVRVCPSAHTGRPWLSISTHISTLVLRLSTLALPGEYSGDFGPHGLSVQYTQDVRGCPLAQTGRPWLSLCVRVCPSAYTGRPWLSISTHISTLVLGLSTLTLPVDCSGYFVPRGLFVQYTQDVRGSPPAHTGRLWQSVAVRQHTQDVYGCLCVSVCVRQHTQDVRGCPSVQISARWSLDSARWPFPLTVRVILAHVGCLFSTHRTSVVVRGCPSAHTGRPWLSVCVCVCSCVSVSTHRTSVAVHQTSVGVRQHTHDIRGCPWLSVCVRQHTQDVRGCPSVHISARWSLDSARWPFPWPVRVILAHVGCLFSTHRLSVGVRQHTQDVRGCPWLSVCVCVCLSAHTVRLWLSISTHISTLVLGLRTIALSVDCSGDFSPRGLSVQYTQDVRVCPSAHTGRPWLSISTHISTLVLGLSTLALPVACSGDFGPRGLSVQYIYDVLGCPPAHTGRPWQSVCVCVCLSAQTVRPWLSISTHISTLVLGLRTMVVPVDCSGDFSPRGLSVQYTPDVRVCLSAHTGRPCVSISTHRTSVCVCQHTQDVCGSPSAQISARWSLDSACWPFPWPVRVILAHVGCLFSTHRTSLGVRQHTQDVRGCPWLSVCVCVCLSAHTVRLWLSISTHISTLVLGLSTMVLPVDFSGDFSPRGLSVQYTQDVRVCQSAHTGRPCVSISTDICTLVLGLSTLAIPVDCLGDFGLGGLSVQTSVAVRVCLCVSVSIHRTSVAVHQYTYQHVGPWNQHADPSRGLFGCFLSTWAVCSVHTGRLRVSANTHMTFVAVCGCPCVSVSTHRTSVAVHHYTYQHVGVTGWKSGWARWMMEAWMGRPKR
ncbi:hypothetical protein YC2023_004395 [Brassica napus]